MADRQLTYSQRYGYEPLPQPMRLEELSDDLRREIWNVTREFLLSIRESYGRGYYFPSKESRFIEHVLGRILKKPEDEVDTSYDVVLGLFKSLILRGPFNVVLDLVQIMINESPYMGSTGSFGGRIRSNEESLWVANRIDNLFERYPAAYWLDTSQYPLQFFPRSGKEQGEATQQALNTIRDSGMEGATTHLRQAAEHINARRYADSIRESISAVESVARRIAPNDNTLGGALKSLEKKGLLKNNQLKKGFEQIYAYTNNEEGVRHSLVFKDSAGVGLDEAIFMFGACASFAAYLTNKHRQAETE